MIDDLMMEDVLEIRKKMGERIRFLRKQRGWGQFRFSQECGLGRVYTGSLERGKSAMGIDSMCKVAAALGITLAELLTGIYDPRSSKKRRVPAPAARARPAKTS